MPDHALHADALHADALHPRPDDASSVERLLAGADPAAPPLGQSGETLWVPVDGAELRVIHVRPAAGGRRAGGRRGGTRGAAVRPIVFVPGWGTTPESFEDFFAAVHGRAELYFVETREKSSSRITDRRVSMGPEQSSRDIARVLRAIGLGGGRDYVLTATCWGATLVLLGMGGGWIEAPTALLADPMHTLWFSRFVLRWISPLVPWPTLYLLRPFMAKAMLGDIQEPTMRRRAMSFVYGADLWKWKRSAEEARELELYGNLGAVRQEVLVLNGTRDKVHDPVHYPRIASEIPRGRFLFMPAEENRREMLFGTAAMELARVRAVDGLPKSLARYERCVR